MWVAIGVGSDIHRIISGALKSCAEKNNVMYQVELLEGCSGTNAWAYQVSGLGIPCGLLSVPIRYMHTPVETVFRQDYDSTLCLLTAYLESLSEEDIKSVSEVIVC